MRTQEVRGHLMRWLVAIAFVLAGHVMALAAVRHNYYWMFVAFFTLPITSIFHRWNWRAEIRWTKDNDFS